ncbi:hypothetical protein ASG90_20490 [Nocardioides sp. Soil797]|nr:hypothetical protein ASG90_20490 [Nocardioides sp. Soil797]
MLNRLFLQVYVGTATRLRDERGDVPGWVMVTVMTAAIVSGLLLIAQPMLKGMLRDALNSVHG